MAVDLSDLVENLQREVNAPGSNNFPDATTADYTGNLQDAFWEATLDGLISGYTESDGLVSPSSGTTDLSRELQQLVIFYAGARIIRNQLRELQTRFRAASGPTEYEYERSANLLKALLDDIQKRKELILARLGDIYASDVHYYDSYVARDRALNYEYTYWVG